ncbi:MAG: outer membrane protein assembly factor BamD [Candidatus Azotimanducaceae bacterium]|jgi:outer membrane protein assembly factor BamD
MRILSITLLLLLTLIGCSKDEVEDDLEATELAYYTSSQQSLRAGNYGGAIQKLQLLESRFPFGRYAEQAQLEIVYAYYKSAQPEAARSAADRFIRLHPGHPNVDYAYYLKGMVSFEQDKNFLSNFIPMDPSTRDPGSARESFNDFAQLIRRYPNSEYAPDAQKRMKYLRNLLAMSEIHVGRYYIQRGAYVAAANRGRYVFENFQGSVAVPDALAIMVEAYQLLEMNELAAQALNVLVSNYPDHKSLDINGNFKKTQSIKNKGRGWLNAITFGLLG